MINTTCPVCKNRTADLLYEVTNDESAKHFIINHQKNQKFVLLKEHLKKLWDGETCQVVKCNQCQFCYANPFVGGDELFYDLACGKTNYPQWRFEFEVTLNAIKDILQEEKSPEFQLLEIGAGDGAFIKQLAAILPTKFISATEYSETGIKQLAKLGVNTYQEDFRQLGHQWSKKFSAVCLFQVLEHLDDIEATFEVLNKITKEKAHLFIAVPNMKRINFHEANGALLDMPPHHIGRYNRRIFEILADRFGWVLKDHRIETSSLTEFLHKFSVYRYQRNAQLGKTLDYFIASNRLLRNRFSLILKLRLLYLRLVLRKLIAENYQQVGGNTQWVYLVKK